MKKYFLFVLFLLMFLISSCANDGVRESENINVNKNNIISTDEKISIVPNEATESNLIKEDSRIGLELKTCSQLNGNLCEMSDTCYNWLDAEDTLFCCASQCEVNYESFNNLDYYENFNYFMKISDNFFEKNEKIISNLDYLELKTDKIKSYNLELDRNYEILKTDFNENSYEYNIQNFEIILENLKCINDLFEEKLKDEINEDAIKRLSLILNFSGEILKIYPPRNIYLIESSTIPQGFEKNIRFNFENSFSIKLNDEEYNYLLNLGYDILNVNTLTYEQDIYYDGSFALQSTRRENPAVQIPWGIQAVYGGGLSLKSDIVSLSTNNSIHEDIIKISNYNLLESGDSIEYIFEPPIDCKNFFLCVIEDVIKKFEELPENTAPEILSFSANPQKGFTPLYVRFTILVRDNDSNLLTCKLNFGDGTSKEIKDSSNCNELDGIEKTYSNSANYTVSLEVYDGRVTKVKSFVINVLKTEFDETVPSGGNGIKIAVLDTGADINHPDLKNRIAACVDFTSGSIRYNYCSDSTGHGTHVAGTIAADAGSDKKGIYGIAPEAKLYIYKVCTSNGCNYDSILRAINEAAKQNVDIVSMSLGGPYEDSSTRNAISKYTNILFIAAAGNDGPRANSIGYPAANLNVVAVAAVDSNLKTASFSSRGLNNGDFIIQNREIELAAPGVNVYSTWPGASYASLRGTSMAAPHVSGTAAKLWKGNAKDTRIEMQNIAKKYDIGPKGDDKETGFGFLKIK